jgi:nucleoside-diphosphate-sugar epimerase
MRALSDDSAIRCLAAASSNAIARKDAQAAAAVHAGDGVLSAFFGPAIVGRLTLEACLCSHLAGGRQARVGVLIEASADHRGLRQDMLSDEKILITGVTGVVAFPIAQALAKDNEVWGMARFSDPAARAKVRAAGVTAVAADIGDGDFAELPTDFTYVLHFGWMRADLDQLEEAFRVNVEGPGLLLQHCRAAKAALFVSSQGVYSPHPDPRRLYVESDPVGRASSAYAPTSPATKLGVESVARYCARAFNLPVTIARLNTVLGPLGAYYAHHVRAVLEGRPIMAPGDPNLHSPIHIEDIALQIEALVRSAGVPALVTNWCGDEVVSTQDTSAYIADRVGKPAEVVVKITAGVPQGNPNDATRRRSLTGPCTVSFAAGLSRVCDEVLAQSAS